MGKETEYKEDKEGTGYDSIVDTGDVEKEDAVNLEMVMGMEVEGEYQLEGDSTLMALVATGFLIKETEPIGKILVNDRNGFNKLSRLAMMCTVQHLWPSGLRSALNCFKHWAQLLLHHPGGAPVILLNQEGVTQGDFLYMVLYGITLVPLEEEIRAADLGLVSPFYVYDVEFDGSERRSAHLSKLHIKRGTDWGHFPKSYNSLFIADFPEQE